ncbi:hypothetical protein H5410_064828 [Solanum commersonii]|uniref:Uncharacterized protein n=1 Tax=Solanum commersonii TaxID=4109 RepID=A0A9J5VY90_SOLCO|nr:hypothetical protein H5410_064828 [Solanum commersonii]
MGALRMGVTGGVMRRRVEARSVGCRLGRWRKEKRRSDWDAVRAVIEALRMGVAGVMRAWRGGWKRRSDWDAVRTGDGGVEDGRDGRRHASSRGG